MPRMSLPEYFMNIAHLVAQRSTCLRRKVGAVAVRDKRILATGYNGAPTGLPHCEEVGCLRQQLAVPSGERHELCRALHAEQNILTQCAVHGIVLKGADIYCTTQPCLICTKLLINSQVNAIWYAEAYPDKLAEQFLDESNIRHGLLKGEFRA